MSQTNTNPDIKLGPLHQVLLHIGLRAMGVALIGGTLIALSSLNRITGIVFPILIFLFGFFILLASYRVTYNKKGDKAWMTMHWNHLIFVGAVILGGIWSAIVQTGICYGARYQRIEWLQAIPLTCSETFFVSERLTSLSIVTIGGFFIFPIILGISRLFRRDDK